MWEKKARAGGGKRILQPEKESREEKKNLNQVGEGAVEISGGGNELRGEVERHKNFLKKATYGDSRTRTRKERLRGAES